MRYAVVYCGPVNVGDATCSVIARCSAAAAAASAIELHVRQFDATADDGGLRHAAAVCNRSTAVS